MPDLLQQALASHQAGRLDEAESLYRRVLQSAPRDPNALHLLGVLENQRGHHESAVARFEQVLDVAPPHPALLNELGKAYSALGRLDAARKCFADAAAMQPDFAEAHGNLGAVEMALGRPEQAVESLRRAVALYPAYPNAHHNLGGALERLGRSEEAERCYRAVLALDPAASDTQVLLANLLWKRERLGEALEVLTRAVALRPDHLDARHNLGRILHHLGQLEEAERCYRAVLALEPRAPNTHVNLANLLWNDGRLDEAEQHFEAALACNPGHAAARWALAVFRASRPEAEHSEGSEEGMAELRSASEWLHARRLDDPESVVGALQPFYLLYQERNHRDLIAEYGRTCTWLMQKWGDLQGLQASLARPSAPLRRLRLGIVSAHVRDHSTWHALVKGWGRHLDRERIELCLFHVGQTEDEHTAVAVADVERFERGPADLRRWVDRIRSWQPDALIFPAIGQDAIETRLAALRLAPLQLAAWSHPETSGFPTIDCYLSAQSFEPPDAQQHYTERLIALPNLGSCYSAFAPRSADRVAMHTDSGEALLLCTGRPFKYAPAHDEIFIEIARRTPNARLVFFLLDPNALSAGLKSRLQASFTRAGLDFDRHVFFLEPLPRPAFYDLMRRASVWLDGIGFSGFMSAMQAVECGLPIVAYEGRFMRGRFASGILRKMGMDEWVATNAEEFIALAAELANNAEKRRDARARIEATRDVLFDDLAPIRALEDFLANAVRG
jgi:predicted O-linked N-acetylglucosamine transferase (SPINDLY family)